MSSHISPFSYNLECFYTERTRYCPDHDRHAEEIPANEQEDPTQPPSYATTEKQCPASSYRTINNLIHDDPAAAIEVEWRMLLGEYFLIREMIRKGSNEHYVDMDCHWENAYQRLIEFAGRYPQYKKDLPKDPNASCCTIV